MEHYINYVKLFIIKKIYICLLNVMKDTFEIQKIPNQFFTIYSYCKTQLILAKSEIKKTIFIIYKVIPCRA